MAKAKLTPEEKADKILALTKLADRIGRQQIKCEAILAKPQFKTLADLQKEAAALADEILAPEEKENFGGKSFVLQFSPEAAKTSVVGGVEGMKQIKERLTEKEFWENISYNIGNIRKLIPNEILDPMLKTVNDGKRPFKCKPITVAKTKASK